MDVQLQELIDKIRKDGVESAETSAASITADAKDKAAGIVTAAEKEAVGIIEKAKAEAKRLEAASVAAIRQAGRNLLISFRDAVTAELSALVSSESAKAYNQDMLKTLIPEVVKAWIKNSDASSISVLLSEKDLESVKTGFTAALKAELSAGLEVKADPSLSAGFRIGTKDGAAYYDFSADTVADLFSAYLNPRVAQIMKDAAKDAGNGAL